MDSERREIERLAEEVSAMLEPPQRPPATLSTERGDIVVKIRGREATIMRDEMGRLAGLSGPGYTSKVGRDEQGRPVSVYEELEEIVPE